MDILKVRFFNAVMSGELGACDKRGITITLKEFVNHFTDIEPGYLNCFLPAATIEKGRTAANYTKYLFRVKRGIYRLHPDAIDIYIENHMNEKQSDTLKSF